MRLSGFGQLVQLIWLRRAIFELQKPRLIVVISRLTHWCLYKMRIAACILSFIAF